MDDLARGFDDVCSHRLSDFASSLRLSAADRSWLARALVGAFRPNRDYPVFMLAHVLALLAANRRGANRNEPLADLLQRPLASHEGLRRLFAQSQDVRLSPSGVSLDGFDSPITFPVVRLCIALAQLLMETDDEPYFEFQTQLADLAQQADATRIQEATRSLARMAHAWRQRHVALAPIERQLRKLTGFLRSRGGTAFEQPADADILQYFLAEAEAGERPVLRSVVELFRTVYVSTRHLRFLPGADGVEELQPTNEARAQWLADLCEDEPEGVEAALEQVPDSPRLLTGAERAALQSLLANEPFAALLPLTTLRALSFGEVQSGILNRLRRGFGGGSVAERAECSEARTYLSQVEHARDLDAWLKDLLRIALAVRVATDEGEAADPRRAEAVRAGLEAMKTRRAGFSADPAQMREPFAQAENALLTLSRGLRAHLSAVERLARSAPLQAAFEADRALFARQFARIYLAPTQGIDHEDARV